jgi:hypothetical protein
MEIQMEINAAEPGSPTNLFAGVDETTFEARLVAIEAKLTELQSAITANVSASVTNTRKTLPVNMATLLNKQGVAIESLEAGTLDAALTSLSVEQRIAVKAQLLRTGFIS